MSPTPGSRFGPYEILSLLGAGGMGEVFRARDTRLKREVALKFLSAPFAQDAERLARFQREAELLATLNHPNIAIIYGLEDGRESSEPAALVMELVEGPTLDDHLKAAADKRQTLLLKEIVDIALQIVDALASAHDRGVIHRDLKPANIKLTPSGQVKVLDFGLAKLAEPAGLGSGPAGLTHSPTLSMQATFAGMILGTAAYMSPEQARGKAVDKRTDIWAFGCVLFEMLAGKRAFDGEDVTDAIASVVAREPDWAALPADLPEQLRLLLRRCLEKDPRKRIGDISTARFLMTEQIASVVPAGAHPADDASWSSRRRMARSQVLTLAGGGLIVGLVVAAVTTWLTLRAPVDSPRPVRFPIVSAAATALSMNGADRDIAISPDGTHLVYRGGQDRDKAQLVVRAFDQLDGQPLPGISGVRSPFVSPDGHWIGFFGGPNDELRKVSITGGPPLALCRYTGVTRGASWGPDGTIVFATNDTSTGLLSVPEGGGEPKVLTKPDAAAQELDHLFPSFLPGGKAVLFTIASGGTTQTAQIAALDLKTGQKKILIRGGSSAEYVDTGHLVYAAGGTLRAVRFDPVRLEVLSDPVPVTDQVMTSGTGAANFAVSRNGTLVFVPGNAGSPAFGGGPQRSLVWMNRQGREEPLKTPIRAYSAPRLSPDDSRLALDIRDQENDIWIWEFARATLTRLTFNQSVDIFPVWTPDGRRIVFGSARTGLMSLYWHAADGTGVDEPLAPNRNVTTPTSFSPDGKTLAVSELTPGRGADISVVHMDAPDGKRQVEPLISTTFIELGAEISPDGRWIAYYSNESGREEVYVRPFPKIDTGRWQISTGGGTRPGWARSGRELFYLSGGSMMAVSVQTSPNFSAGNPVKLFDGPFYAGQNTRTYDVSKDAQRFLMIKTTTATTVEQGAQPSMVFVEHWTEELKARVPVK